MHETQWGSTILNKIQIWQVFFPSRNRYVCSPPFLHPRFTSRSDENKSHAGRSTVFGIPSFFYFLQRCQTDLQPRTKNKKRKVRRSLDAPPSPSFLYVFSCLIFFFIPPVVNTLFAFIGHFVINLGETPQSPWWLPRIIQNAISFPRWLAESSSAAHPHNRGRFFTQKIMPVGRIYVLGRTFVWTSFLPFPSPSYDPLLSSGSGRHTVNFNRTFFFFSPPGRLTAQFRFPFS